MRTVTVTSKYQVYLPLDIREKAGLITHGPVHIRADAGKIIIEPKPGTLISLAGKYKSKASRKVDIDNIRDRIDYSDL